MFRSVLPAQAALLPLFGALKMVPEQLHGALSICRLALPKATVSEAKKRSTTDVFSYKRRWKRYRFWWLETVREWAACGDWWRRRWR